MDASDLLTPAPFIHYPENVMSRRALIAALSTVALAFPLLSAACASCFFGDCTPAPVVEVVEAEMAPCHGDGHEMPMESSARLVAAEHCCTSLDRAETPATRSLPPASSKLDTPVSVAAASLPASPATPPIPRLVVATESPPRDASPPLYRLHAALLI